MAWGGLPTWEADRWVKTTPANPVILSPSAAWEGGSSGALGEPNLITPDLSPDGNWWLVYRGGWNSTGIGVATCPVASDPANPANWTKNAGNPVFQPNTSVQQPAVNPLGKIGGSYYMIFNKGVGQTTCFRYATSTDGLTWTDGGQALAPTNGNWWWQGGSPQGGNTDVYFDGTTYHLFFEARVGTPWNVGRATASSPGGPYTEAGGNPITSIQVPGGTSTSGPCLRKIGSAYHLWLHQQGGIAGNLPSDVYRYLASSLSGTWARQGPGVPSLRRTESGSGLSAQDQLAGLKVYEYAGKVYGAYDIDDNINAVAKICMVTSAGTMAQLVA